MEEVARHALARVTAGTGRLPTVSTATIGTVLHDAGFVWQRDRSGCETGASVRKRKGGPVTAHDPDAVAKST